MSTPKYLAVKNWERYQHYKDRNPIWIKFYLAALATGDNHDPDFSLLADSARLLYPYILLLAAKTGNRIPNNPEWIRIEIGLNEVPDLSELIKHGFLIPVPYNLASKVATTRDRDRDRYKTSPHSPPKPENEKPEVYGNDPFALSDTDLKAIHEEWRTVKPWLTVEEVKGAFVDAKRKAKEKVEQGTVFMRADFVSYVRGFVKNLKEPHGGRPGKAAKATGREGDGKFAQAQRRREEELKREKGVA